MNPYKILNVSKNAKPSEIKKAYFTLAKIHHPDVGGDANEFNKIKLAYDTLMDPVRRILYDKEGIIEGDPDSEKQLLAIKMLKQLFINVLQSVNAEEIQYFDIVGNMKSVIDSNIATIRNNVDGLVQSEKRTTQAINILRKKLKRKGKKHNFFIELLLEQIKVVNTQILHMKNEISVQEEMLRMLKEFSYDPESREDFFTTCTPRYFYTIPTT